MYGTVRSVLFRMDPERAHNLALLGLGMVARSPLLQRVVARQCAFCDPRLEQTIGGVRYANPIGLAAGFDKNGTAVSTYQAFGFGYAVIGSVTESPWPGNPKPRLFRLPDDRALINRMGLNSAGCRKVVERLDVAASSLSDFPVWASAVQMPQTSGSDWFISPVEKLARIYGLAGIELNISCPNSPGGRTYEDPDLLNGLLNGLRRNLGAEQMSRLQMVAKLSPDIDRGLLSEIVCVCRTYGLGYIGGNSTKDRNGLRTDLGVVEQIGSGGLTGKPLIAKNLGLVERLRELAGDDAMVIGCGGISSAGDAWDYLSAGANLVQLLTGWVYGGPGLVRNILTGLLDEMERRGIVNIAGCVR